MCQLIGVYSCDYALLTCRCACVLFTLCVMPKLTLYPIPSHDVTAESGGSESSSKYLSVVLIDTRTTSENVAKSQKHERIETLCYKRVGIITNVIWTLDLKTRVTTENMHRTNRCKGNSSMLQADSFRGIGQGHIFSKYVTGTLYPLFVLANIYMV